MNHFCRGGSWTVTILCVLALYPLHLFAREEKNARPKINWQRGPALVKLGDQAEVNLPAGYLFADVANTRKLLEMTENIPSGKELGSVAAVQGRWFAIFEFEPVGYVKDSEKDSLDAAAILKSIQEGTEAANEERKKRGWDTFTVTGWIDPPHYDTQTHQFTWSLVGHDGKGVESANYRTRVLGRRGVMSIELVADPGQLNTVLPVFQSAATGSAFHFTPENRYAAFVKGDKVAEYGLTALIAGGAAAAAVKMGLFKYVLKFLAAGWKLIVIGLGAIGAFLKKLFTRPKRPASAESVPRLE